jgi:lipopolysaccharide export system protein LptC
VVNQDGDQLESEVLHWNPNEQLIHTEEFVRFTRGDQILTGYGMDTDPDLTNVNIHRQFEGDLPANQEPVDGEGR